VARILHSCSGYAGFWPWLLAAAPRRQESAKTRFCVIPGFGQHNQHIVFFKCSMWERFKQSGTFAYAIHCGIVDGFWPSVRSLQAHDSLLKGRQSQNWPTKVPKDNCSRKETITTNHTPNYSSHSSDACFYVSLCSFFVPSLGWMMNASQASLAVIPFHGLRFVMSVVDLS
jgi:hypothetical protein